MSIELNDEEKALLKDGRLVDTIKAIRARLNLDLLTAKRVVDAFRGHGDAPGVTRQFSDEYRVIIDLPTRDFLAGQALAGLLAGRSMDAQTRRGPDYIKLLAEDAVIIADATLSKLRGV